MIKEIITDFHRVLKEIGWKLIVVTIMGAAFILISWLTRDIYCTIRFASSVWEDASNIQHQFYVLVLWFINYGLAYFLLPCLVVLLVYKGKFRDFGLGWGNLTKHLPVYGILYLIMLPVIVITSLNPSFIHVYPFFRAPEWSLLIQWEILYMIQFTFVEFFFRGFLLFAFVQRVGSVGILFSVIPYCLIHLEKPVPEALGAIFTGIILGYFAMKTRSIWGGVLLHASIALTMDLASILQQDKYF